MASERTGSGVRLAGQGPPGLPTSHAQCNDDTGTFQLNVDEKFGIISKATSSLSQGRRIAGHGRPITASHIPKGNGSQDLGHILKRKKALGLT